MPVDLIIPVYTQLKNSWQSTVLEADINFRNFIQYYEGEWLYNSSVPIAVWSFYSRGGRAKCTNNDLEGLHGSEIIFL
jgi:hypothetical protein